jgi:hypothetical protein
VTYLNQTRLDQWQSQRTGFLKETMNMDIALSPMRLQAYKEAVRSIQLVTLHSKLKLPAKYIHTVSCVFNQNVL